MPKSAGATFSEVMAGTPEPKAYLQYTNLRGGSTGLVNINSFTAVFVFDLLVVYAVAVAVQNYVDAGGVFRNLCAGWV